MAVQTASSARPSRWWIIAAAAFGLIACVAAIAATVYQQDASRPIGEGRLFLADASGAVDRLAASPDAPPDVAVRRIRNDLEIEGVSIIADDGTIETSTSANLEGQPVDNPLVGFAHSESAFAAAAMPIRESIAVDGIIEWTPGDTLYAVVHPLPDGNSLLLHYDMSTLLARRSQASGVVPGTLILLGIATACAALVSIALIGRTRAAARFRVLETESELLRKHSRDLERHNIELEVARTAAEEALALAEEKNRIRSEFVLMINHELRTPLTSVLTGAQLLAEGGLRVDDTAQILDDMLRDGERLEQMISQILAVARIENRGLASTVVDIDASEAWERIIASLPPKALPSNEPPPDERVSTDPDTIAHLVASLVDNAYQHGANEVRVVVSGEPVIDPRVTVGGDVSPGIVIAVSDDGNGISPGFLPRVFEKFEKDSFSSGTGLGLYITRLMAEAIGCSVGVISSDSGSTFQVMVPGAPQLVRSGEAA